MIELGITLITLNIIFGLILAYKSIRVTFIEFVIVSVVVWVLFGVTSCMQYHSKLSDTRFVNDNIVSMRYEQPWVSSHTCCKQRATRCTGSGKSRSCSSYCARWGTCYDNEGNYSEYTLSSGRTFRVANKKRAELANLYFEDSIEVKGYRPNYSSGSRKDDFYEIKEGVIAPWSGHESYKNYIAASENIIKSNLKVSKKVSAYPAFENPSLFNFNKIIGIDLDQRKLAIVNSILKNKANIVIHGFKNGSFNDCEQIQSKWQGGKSNDLVLCLLHDDETIYKVKVFGWTKAEELKFDIEALFTETKLEEFFNKQDQLIKLINDKYIVFNTEEYNYLDVKFDEWDICWAIIFFLLFSGLGWGIAYKNDHWDSDENSGF